MEIWEKPNIEPVRRKVDEFYIKKAKETAKRIESNGRQLTPDSWKGFAAEFICSDILKEAYPRAMEIEAQGLGDDWMFDIQMAGIKIDVKCGTTGYYTICPMANQVKQCEDTVMYIGCKYIENKNSHDVVEIYGSIHKDKVLKCEEKWFKDKKRPFFEVHLDKMNNGILRKLKSNI